MFASGLRWFYSVILSLDISITEFDLTNVSFCSLVLLFKKIIILILDEYTLNMTPKGFDGNLHIDNQSSGSSQSTSTKAVSAHSNMANNMHDTLKDIAGVLYELQRIKETKGISFVVDGNSFSHINASGSMSDFEADELNDRVKRLYGDYISHADRYNKLLKLDTMLHEGKINNAFKDHHSDFMKLHDSLIEKKNKKGGCSSIGRATVCGTVGFLFKSGYPPFYIARIVQLVRTLISCIKNENSNFSPG